MFSSQAFSNPLDDFPEEESPLGLFFSSPSEREDNSQVSLHLSSPLLSDSLFLNHLSTVPVEEDVFRDAQIYFPDALNDETEILHWQIDQPTKSFSQFQKEQAAQPDANLLESIVLQLCEIVHVLHSNEQANIPITSHMLRFREDGSPLLLVLPVEAGQAFDPATRKAIFPPLFSAPELEQRFGMHPQAYSYNIGVLAALLNGYVPDNTSPAEALHAELQAWISNMPDSPLKEVLQQSLDADCELRPYCPMKLHKALCGSQPHDCVNCQARESK